MVCDILTASGEHSVKHVMVAFGTKGLVKALSIYTAKAWRENSPKEAMNCDPKVVERGI